MLKHCAFNDDNLLAEKPKMYLCKLHYNLFNVNQPENKLDQGILTPSEANTLPKSIKTKIQKLHDEFIENTITNFYIPL
jgi:predicted AlkP superfamily phosphohydrolase/phosphomutase